MSTENQQDQTEPIDLTKVDWSNMDVEEFKRLDEKLEARNQNLKADKVRKDRTASDKIIVTIHGDSYEIPLTLYNRLKDMKSERSKEKLKDEIVTTFEKVVSI